MDADQLARRLRAARALAGLDSVEQVAAAINEKGLGTKTLRAIEQGKRPAYRRELLAIADACGVPVSFFTDADPLADGQDPLGDGVQEQLDRLEQLVVDAAEAARRERADLAAQIGELEQLVRQLQDSNVIERSAAAAVRSLPEWPAPPRDDKPPAHTALPATGTSDREGH